VAVVPQAFGASAAHNVFTVSEPIETTVSEVRT
jgi:hypothetical protein